MFVSRMVDVGSHSKDHLLVYVGVVWDMKAKIVFYEYYSDNDLGVGNYTKRGLCILNIKFVFVLMSSKWIL